MLFNRKTISRGFTLIEIILYVSLVTVLTSALIPFSWNVIQSGVKASVEQDITSQARYLSERIKYEIRNADAINSVSATSLDLATATNPRTIIDLSGGKMRIRYGLTGTPIELNANNTSVTSLLFTNRSSSDYKTQNIQYSFTISDTLTSVRQEYSVPPTTIQGSVSVRTPVLVTPTPGGPTATPVPPTNTPVPPTATAIPPTATPVGGWWAYRKQITIQDAQVAGTTNFTNFPVLINLSSDADLAARAQDDGDDIYFTLSDGVTKLDHEIETFNGTTGQLVAWVQVSTLNATANTTIYLYYGNTVATNQQNITGTWDGNYRGVWHMKENPAVVCAGTQEVCDSTSNNRDADADGAMTSSDRVSGKIGYALEFDGVDDRLLVNNFPASSTTMGESGTVSVWVRPYVDHSNKGIVGFYQSRPLLYFGGIGQIQAYNTDITDDYSCSAPITINAYNHVVWVWNNNTVTIYINGAVGCNDTTWETTFNRVADTLFIGGYSDGNLYVMTGQLDELHAVSTNRSASWVQTEYNNQNSPATFYTLGAQQVL